MAGGGNMPFLVGIVRDESGEIQVWVAPEHVTNKETFEQFLAEEQLTDLTVLDVKDMSEVMGIDNSDSVVEAEGELKALRGLTEMSPNGYASSVTELLMREMFRWGQEFDK
jgi:hypothetical protein